MLGLHLKGGPGSGPRPGQGRDKEVTPKEKKEFTLKISKVLVLTGMSGADHVSITIDAPNPFPKAGYSEPVTLEMTTEKGFGAKYAEDLFGVKPEVVITQVERGKFSR